MFGFCLWLWLVFVWLFSSWWWFGLLDSRLFWFCWFVSVFVGGIFWTLLLSGCGWGLLLRSGELAGLRFLGWVDIGFLNFKWVVFGVWGWCLGAWFGVLCLVVEFCCRFGVVVVNGCGWCRLCCALLVWSL